MIETARDRLGALADLGYSILVDIQTETPRVVTSSFDPPWTADEIKVSVQKAVALPALAGGGPDGEGSANETLLSVFHDLTRIAALKKHQAAPETDEDLRDAKAAMIVLADSVEPAEVPSLDAKEIAYLRLVVDGQSDAEIAETLSLSLRAIKERKKRTLIDLGATSIAHAIRLATASQQI